jgi:hypothetical protein
MNSHGSSETLLVSPLEWGLGHTVRVVPFILEAIEQGHRVILASDGRSLDFLRHRFPDLAWVRMPFYPVSYPEDGRFLRKIVRQIPGILKAIRQNRRQLDEIVSTYQVTRILSDHRYGLYHKNVHSIFVTNQLWLKAPKGWSFGEGVIYWLHRFTLRKFSEIWIADHEGAENLSGQLTHPMHLPARAKYIGPVTRFRGVTLERPAFAQPFEVLALVSGPEPQRTIFENLLIERFKRTKSKAVIFRGLPPVYPDIKPTIKEIGNIVLIDHASDGHLLWYLLQASEIICRPGNSTLSDLDFLGKTAWLVPTPGQTEQEYIARQLERSGRYRLCEQKDLVPKQA